MPKYTLENLPEGITPKDLRLVGRYDRLSKLYATRATLLKDKIKAAFGPVNLALGGIIIKTTTRMTLDTAAFEEAYPADRFPAYYKTVLNVTAIPKTARVGFEVEGLSTTVAESA